MQNIPFINLENAGTAPVLHFAHANAYPPAAYLPFLRHLQNNYHILAAEHRPLWQGSHPNELHSWHLIGDDLIHFLDQQNCQAILGVGHSLGAVTTLYAATKRPDLFRAVVLIDPVFFHPHFLAAITAHQHHLQPEDTPLVRTALNRRSRWASHAEAFTHLRSKRVFARLSDEALWAYIQGGLQENADGQVELRFPPAWEARIYSLAPTDIWELLPQLSQPTLAIRASESDTLLPEAWQLWQKTQPHATFIELPESDHLLPLSHPNQIAQLIFDFDR